MKRYNAVSYANGDRLINQIASVLMEAIRPGDFVGRWRFGDEFVLLLPDTKVSEAVPIADRVRARVEIASRSWLFPVTVSVGVVGYPIHGRSEDELVFRAEGALKSAKAAERNKTVVAE